MMRHKIWVAGLSVVLLVAPWSIAAGQKRSLTESDLLKLLAGGVYSDRIATLVRERGIAFSPSKRDFQLLENAGANQELQRAVEAAQARSSVSDQEPADAKPLIIWHRIDGHWHWHCIAHCSKYRTYHTSH